MLATQAMPSRAGWSNLPLQTPSVGSFVHISYEP